MICATIDDKYEDCI